MGDIPAARVLVVEDDHVLAAMVETSLRADGFDVCGAPNGAVGLERVITFRPEVVVFDFWMPVADGRELLQGIREVAKVRVGLVAMSGTPEVADWCERTGVREFLSKPFEHAEMRAAVGRALEEVRSPSLPRRASDPPTSRRIRIDRAVLVVGEGEAVRAVRALLREANVPMQVALVQAVDDAVRALAGISVDAVAVCGDTALASPHLAALVAESAARNIPVVIEGAPAEDLPPHPSVHFCTDRGAREVVALVQRSLGVAQ